MTGDIGLLGGLPGLAYLDLGQTAVTGDVGGLRGLAALRFLYLDGTAAAGATRDRITVRTSTVNNSCLVLSI